MAFYSENIDMLYIYIHSRACCYHNFLNTTLFDIHEFYVLSIFIKNTELLCSAFMFIYVLISRSIYFTKIKIIMFVCIKKHIFFYDGSIMMLCGERHL
jgi:hypothetical protein